MNYKLAALLIVCATSIALAGGSSRDVIWVDFDMENIKEPKERKPGEYYTYFESIFTGQAKQATDLGRLGRMIIGKPKPAANTNALDEVPNSSWYTNRHHLRPMTLDQLARGPNKGSEPDFSKVQITSAKTQGVTPGLQVKDKNGDGYIVKFDLKEYPELQSGAEVVSTKILHAAGYNVPENYIAYMDIENMHFEKDFKVSGKPFSREDLRKLLERVARRPDGRYRVLASRMLKGKLKGPFPQVGLRRDDPNDLIPHEHRRELRALRVIASWINHWDMKQTNSLDMYVEERGRKFLRHYLIDFGSTLGGSQEPLNNTHGHEYAFDIRNVLKEMVTGGFYKSPSEKRVKAFSPAMGLFRAEDFNPGHWKPSVNVIPFENLTDQDAFWGARIVLSFTKAELRKIIETAEYTDPRDAEYLLQTLLSRQRAIAGYWLKRVSPLSDFAVKAVGDGLELRFRDLMAQHLKGDASVEYTYQIKGNRHASNKMASRTTAIKLSWDQLRAALGENPEANSAVDIIVWSKRQGSLTNPVRIRLENALSPATVRLAQIARLSSG